MNPAKVDGWNVAHLAGGLLLSTNDFMLQLGTQEVDKFLLILNARKPGKIRDANGDAILVTPNGMNVILKRLGDKVYPDGIILPVKAFSEFEAEQIAEAKQQMMFFRKANRIKHGFPKVVAAAQEKKELFIQAMKAHLPTAVSVKRIPNEVPVRGLPNNK